MSIVGQLVGAIVTEINGGVWKLPLRAEAAYRPRFELAELDVLHVTVAPRSLTIDPADRLRDMIHYQVDVAIQRRLDNEDFSTLEPLLELVEQLAQYFRLRRPVAMPAALCIKVENDPIYAVEHLDELRCFTSILTLSFQVMR
ncbi:MAG: hypothetical protein AB7E55_32345 [Pigmentiphaga sp.]